MYTTEAMIGIVPVGETVNVHEDANAASRVLFTLSRGAIVTKWSLLGECYGINTKDGCSGFFKSNLFMQSYVDPGNIWEG